MEYSQQGKGLFYLKEKLSKLFCLCVHGMKPVNTHTHKFLFFYICYFHLSNYGGEPLLSLIFHKTVITIRLCHKYEQGEHHSASQWRKNYLILGSIWSKDLCSHMYSACNPHTQLAKLLFRGYTKMAVSSVLKFKLSLHWLLVFHA